MKTVYRVFSILVVVTYILALYPAESARVCRCRIHHSECPCCLASVSNPAPSLISSIFRNHEHSGTAITSAPPRTHPAHCSALKKARVGETSLYGSCRCRESKESTRDFFTADLIPSGMAVTLDKGNKMFCWNIGHPMPPHPNPPMKPPPIV